MCQGLERGNKCILAIDGARWAFGRAGDHEGTVRYMALWRYGSPRGGAVGQVFLSVRCPAIFATD